MAHVALLPAGHTQKTLTILLTGSTGFLGSRIAEELQIRGLEWRPLTVRLDQTDSGDVQGASTVIHCAGLIPGRSSRDEEFSQVNTQGTRRLLEACERSGAGRFVYVSSMGVKFSSAYGQSKLAAEDLVRRSGFEWLILRPAHIYGATDHLRGTFAKLKRKNLWYVLGSGRQLVHYVYVEDCAAAVVEAALSSKSRETFNVVGPECSELDYVRTLRSVVASKIIILPTPLFWARMRKGKDAVDIRLSGMRIPGVADWKFSATPLENAMRELHERFEAKTRVLYLHPRAWIGEYAMLQELRARGFDVCALEEKRDLEQGARHVASFYRSPGDGVPTVWYDPRRGAERLLTWIPDRIFRKGFGGRNLVHRMWVIRAVVRRFRPDVVVCSDGYSYAIPAAFLKRLGLLRERLIVNYIGGDILDCSTYGYGMRRTPLVSWLIRNSLRGIDVMRALCASLERALLKEGAEASRITVLPIQLASPIALVDEIYARRAQCGQLVRSRYGIPPAARLVVTLSGNQRSKGMHDLANAWAGISAVVPDCHWLLCGSDDPWLSQSVWPVLRASGLSERVHFTGFLHGRDVCEHLAAADLHVNPTLCEGLNMATVEAAAVGTPSVTSDGAGIADWVQSFDAGLVVPAGDVPALRDAVVRALEASELRTQWPARSRDMAAHFSPDRIASDFVKLLGGDGLRP